MELKIISANRKIKKAKQKHVRLDGKREAIFRPVKIIFFSGFVAYVSMTVTEIYKFLACMNKLNHVAAFTILSKLTS